MHRKTWAWLPCTLLCAPAVATASSVTLFGLMDTGLDLSSAGGPATARMQSGQYAGSRFGLRGTEDLGDGLQAVFVLENGLNSDTGVAGQSGRLFGRQAYVGLSGRAGALTLGRQYSPLVSVAFQMDAFENGMAPQFPNLGLYPGGERIDNAIKYTSPSFGGLTMAAMLALGERSTAPRAGDDSYGVNVHYASGPMRLVAAYGVRKFASAAALGEVVKPVVVLPNVVTNGSITTYMAGGNYDFGLFALHGGYQRQRIADDVYFGRIDQDLYTLSVAVPVGKAGRFLAGYTFLNDHSPAQLDASLFGFGFVYSLSRRTSVYTSTAWLNNHNGAGNVIGGNTSPGLPLAYPGANARTIQVGLRHAF